MLKRKKPSQSGSRSRIVKLDADNPKGLQSPQSQPRKRPDGNRDALRLAYAPFELEMHHHKSELLGSVPASLQSSDESPAPSWGPVSNRDA